MQVVMTSKTRETDITAYVAALQRVASAVETLEHGWYVTGARSTYQQAEAEMVAAMEGLRAASRGIYVPALSDVA